MFRRVLFFSAVIFSCLAATAQVPDFIALKKRNGVTVRNFYAGGWPITFQATDGRIYEGPINKIKNDSLHLTLFQVNRLQTIWGTYIYDTVNVYTVPFHYKEIQQIFLPTVKKRKGHLRTLGKMMQMGGFGYDVVNIVNSFALQNVEPLHSKRNLTNLAIATSVGLAGVVINRTVADIRYNTRKYRIEYINMQ